jgi:hypothetical protein
MTPRYSSGASIATRSTGSWSLPSMVRVHLRLADRQLEPSRRIISTSTAS